MGCSTLTIRLDDSLKKDASNVASYYGLDLSSVTRAFYKQMVNTNCIPLTFTREEPNEESIQAIKEGEVFLASEQSGRFTDAKSLIEAALR